eukprot:2745997-Rhodomonas_salina.2
MAVRSGRRQVEVHVQECLGMRASAPRNFDPGTSEVHLVAVVSCLSLSQANCNSTLYTKPAPATAMEQRHELGARSDTVCSRNDAFDLTRARLRAGGTSVSPSLEKRTKS